MDRKDFINKILLSASGTILALNTGHAQSIQEDGLHNIVKVGFAKSSLVPVIKSTTGFRRKLESRCAVIKDNITRVAIVALDLIEISPQTNLFLQNRISQLTGFPVECILLHTTHTHASPWDSREENSMIGLGDEIAKTIINADSLAVPAKIKTCSIRCSPPGFSFRIHSGESIKGRFEVEVTGCREDGLKLESEAGWIKEISMTGSKGKKRIYEFSIDPSGITNTQKGIKYKANIILRSSSEIKKVPVEVGFRLKPHLATGIQKIILRGINLQKKTEVVFSVINTGEGNLDGTAETDRDWLKITPLSFSTGKKQEFRIVINPENASKALVHGNITIKTNGGNAKIPLFASAALNQQKN